MSRGSSLRSPAAAANISAWSARLSIALLSTSAGWSTVISPNPTPVRLTCTPRLSDNAHGGGRGRRCGRCPRALDAAPCPQCGIGVEQRRTDHEAPACLDPALERCDRRMSECIAPLLENQHGLGLQSAHGRDLARMNAQVGDEMLESVIGVGQRLALRRRGYGNGFPMEFKG